LNNLFGPEPEDPQGVVESPTGRYAQVAPERGLEREEGLTYAVPEGMEDLGAGDRVTVPLGRGNRAVRGYVLGVGEARPEGVGRVKLIADRDREGVRLPPSLIELARWMAEYYCCPLGMVLVTMLPAAVKQGTGLIQERLVDLPSEATAEGFSDLVKRHKLPPKQTETLGKAVELAAMEKLPIEARSLADAAGAKSVSPVKQLVAKGLLRYVESERVRARELEGDEATAADPSMALSEDQAAALEAIGEAVAAGGFVVRLLHGVTGSGKTEVYIRAIEPVVASGRSALVLVPEIALTPQTVARFVGRFERVAVLHSGLTAAQRHEQWQRVRDGKAQVVVGARSAVFAPLDNLGLVIVDEEHDAGYKQDQAPRYHGRDVAIKRAQMADVPVLLGSATPSLESYFNATRRKVSGLLSLPRRVLDRPMPRVEVVDLLDDQRRRRQTGDRGVHLLSERMEQALRQTVKDGGQAMLLLNRRGFANYIACPDRNCGWVMQCELCDVNMVYHKDRRVPAGGVMRCHYCGFENRLPNACPNCGNNLTVFGLGTQRVEEELGRKMPSVRLLRMDSDAMRTGRDYQQSLQRFRTGEVDLLVGTQMIAKGLDFPNVRLVGVVSADTALNLPDFRAGERTFQLIAQVAGRSGRGETGGLVVVQTFTPTAKPIRFAVEHDYTGFAEWELAHREEAALPPWRRMARIVCRDTDRDRANEAADALSEALGEVNQEEGTGAVLLGPMYPPIERIAGFFRVQIEIIASDAGRLQRLLGAARRRGALRSDAHMAVDVDPVALL